jgi:hypothetical protein
MNRTKAAGTYTYDGKSFRVKKVSGGATTVYIFSGSKVIAEYSGTSAPYPLAREYIYSGGALLAKIESGATKYYHPDHLSNRVVSLQGRQSGTNPGVGVMIRETLNANSTQASAVYLTNPLVELLSRTITGGGSTSSATSGSTPLPYWVKVVRSGSTFSAYISPNGTAWTQVGSSQAIYMATNVYIGFAVCGAVNTSLVTATFDNVSLVSTPWTPPQAPWLDQDVGAVGVPGNASYANGVFTVSGAGPQVWGTSDGMHFVYQPMSGDGSIVARVLSVQGMYPGTIPEVGVMIRETLNPGSTHAYTAYRTNTPGATTGPITELLWRAGTGGSTSYVNSSSATPLPYWVKIVRSGSTFRAYISLYGVTWTQVGLSQTIGMTTNAYIGLAVSSNDSNNNSLVTATFDNVSVSSSSAPAAVVSSIWPTTGVPGYDVLVSGTGFGTSQGNSAVLLNGMPLLINYWSATSINVTIPPGATSGPLAVFVAPSMNGSNPATFKVLPAPMLDQDVGSVGVQGNASYGNGVFTVSGAGPSIWGTADGFHFVYRPLSGDGTIVARVLSVQGMRSGTTPEVGVMIRETLSANSTHVFSVYRTNPLIELMYRASTGGSTSFVNSGSTPLPYWVKVVRSGNSFTSYISPNGTTWAQVGSTQTINMAQNAYVGLAVSSNDSNNNSLVTATIDNVSITSTVAQPPVITDINPFSGPVGASVTISGANFGPQGASTVTFNGVAAGPGVWTPTAITVPVPYGAISGNIVVKANGMNSNGVLFSVLAAPSITSLNPTSGLVGSPVTITGTNFGSSQGSSTVKFNGISAAPAPSWGPTSIQLSVPPGATTGSVVINVSGVPSNAAYFTVTSSGPSITNLSPASGPVSTSVTIIGSNFGTSQGLSTVKFNGVSAPPASTWNATTIVTTVPTGATTGPVLVTVNGVSSNPATFTIYSAPPGSSTLVVSPGKISMVVGQTQAVQLLDQNGVPIASPAWSIANPSLASIVSPVNQGDPTLLQANAIGNTTLTGTSPDNRTGTAQVSVLAGTSLPIGTVQWEIPSLNNAAGGITDIVQSLRIDDNTPDLYVLDKGASDADGVIRAFTSDGQQKWTFTTPGRWMPSPPYLVADDQGGVLYQALPSYPVDDGPSILGHLDENANLTWSWPIPSWTTSNIAIHPDGTVYFVQERFPDPNVNINSVVALDGKTGQLKFSIPLPTVSYTGADFTSLPDPDWGPVPGGDGYPHNGWYCTPGTALTLRVDGGTYGRLTVSSDGTIYLPIGKGTNFFDGMPCDPTPDPLHPGFPHLVKNTDGVSLVSSYLQVLAIRSDGSYSIRQLDSASASGSGYNGGAVGAIYYSFPGVIGLVGATPDGNGGTLVAVNPTQYLSTIPSAFYHDTGSAVSKLNLSFNPTSEILTGEDGTAYLAGFNPSPSTTGAIVAINTASNTINWTVSLPSGVPKLFAVPGTGGAIFTDHSGHFDLTDLNGVVSPLFPGTGGIDAGPLNATLATFRNPGTWLVIQSSGGVGAVIGNFTNLTATDRPMVNGDPQGQSAPPSGDMELVWCANNGCSDLPLNYTQDVVYYTHQPGPPATNINFTPAQQKILTDSAWTAFKQAFSAYNVNVGMGGSGITPTHTAYIVGTITLNTSDCGLTDGNKESWSWVFYQMNMSAAQTAINILTSNPTQAQLNQLAQAIGEGIGNNAAHEIAHELVNKFNKFPGKIVNRMDLDDTSLDTYNEGPCGGDKAPWLYTGSGNDGVHPGQTPIHWSPNADQSLANIYGRRQH